MQLNQSLTPTPNLIPMFTNNERVELGGYHPEHAFRPGCGYLPRVMLALELQERRAIERGEVWSPAHRQVLLDLHQSFVLVGTGMGRGGRTAWPLAFGTGKSEAVLAFIGAQAEVLARGDRPISTLVCCSQIEDISGVVTDLVKAGVSRDLIGVFHCRSQREAIKTNVAPATDHEQLHEKLFLISTQESLLRGEERITLVNTYRGKDRDLIIWDESMIKSQSDGYSLLGIKSAIGSLADLLEFYSGVHQHTARDALNYLNQVYADMRQDYDCALLGEDPKTATVPALPVEMECEYRAAVSAVFTGTRDKLTAIQRDTLVSFLENHRKDFRVLQADGKPGAIWYRLRVPERLSRLVILDASHNVRMLTSKYDTSIRGTTVDCKVKTFEKVKVAHYQVAAGRDKLDTALATSASVQSKLLVEIIGKYPADEQILVCTFKARKSSNAHQVQAVLRRAGIEPHQTLDNGKPRFVWITWGQHIGTNAYRECKHLVAAGVLRLDGLVMAAAIAAQCNNLLTSEASDRDGVQEALLSEMFHHLVQFGGRGTARKTDNGSADEMTLDVVCGETFPATWWQEAMPGVCVDLRNAETERVIEFYEERSQAILKVLAGLPYSQSSISTASLKVLAELQGVPPKVYSKLLTVMLTAGIEGWTRDERSLVRYNRYEEQHDR